MDSTKCFAYFCWFFGPLVFGPYGFYYPVKGPKCQPDIGNTGPKDQQKYVKLLVKSAYKGLSL